MTIEQPLLNPPPMPNVAKRRWRWMDVREALTGYIYVTPALVIIGMFGFFPIVYAFYMSMYQWRVRQGRFLGLDNYLDTIGSVPGLVLFLGGFGLWALVYWLLTDRLKEVKLPGWLALGIGLAVFFGGGSMISNGFGMMLAEGDKAFLSGLPLTVFYALGTVPIEVGLGLVIAYILFQNIRGKSLFRMLYFLPYITPVVAAAVVFRTIFSPREAALMNQILGLFGVEPLRWLHEPTPALQLIAMQVLGQKLPLEGFWQGPSLAMVSVVLFGIWNYTGYNVVIFLAGLGNVPKEVYEAAEIDGANPFQVFWNITVPLISPVTFYLLLVAFIGTFKSFNSIYVMRSPQAQGTLDTASIVIFDNFFKANNYGDATAMAILLFLVIAALTYAQNKVIGGRVFYG